MVGLQQCVVCCCTLNNTRSVMNIYSTGRCYSTSQHKHRQLSTASFSMQHTALKKEVSGPRFGTPGLCDFMSNSSLITNGYSCSPFLPRFQMVGLPDFRSHSKSGSFATQPLFNHLKSRQFRFQIPTVFNTSLYEQNFSAGTEMCCRAFVIWTSPDLERYKAGQQFTFRPGP